MSEKKKVGRPTEWTPPKLDKLGKELHDFCKKPDVWHVSEFEVGEKGQSPGWLKTIASRHAKFRPILKGAQAILGQKMVKSSMDGGGNNWVIGKFIPMYLKDVDEFDEDKKDKQLARELKKEKYKYEMGAAKHEEAGAKIDMFHRSTELALDNLRLREEIEELKGK